ncbi:exodeoxyribonuclease VII large subunit [Paludicola sp. MB14-C6]|uniref:exodeoxyribonuclease VII large subunit n=1 Tax=Paludihabitans sp. MB14-C6 TaxID=3070656 RepID=UPI0027DCAD92|nr:exodeoxyribonuclease VII large subunit [Paludicola sp. MB14-C6]WMJ23031.1 exodeoxyribonuclease VII large subunit [Paludicola sp. MB14-C6]
MDNAISVSQLNRYIKDLISSDGNLRNITLKGEISNFTNHIKTGHFYFTLKDNASSIKTIMFKGNASKVKFDVENGMNVIVTGSVQVFERDGAYQFYCDTLEPDGIGALYLAFEQLKQKLAAKGLFDEAHKKPIPTMPQKIGIVTSKTGAALQDILNILTRRYPLGTVVLIPALVQGENAPDSIVSGIQIAEQTDDIDVLIVGRGGGSIEDLWAFNDEKVAMAIYECKIPIISAVGHEIDFTISDFVADLRAPTPSAAAELCAPDISQLYKQIETLSAYFDRYTVNNLKARFDGLKASYQRLVTLSPSNKIAQGEQELQAKVQRLTLAMDNIQTHCEQRYHKDVSMLEALSPLKVITRGYSITYSEKGLVSSIDEIQKGERIITKLRDGEIISAVQDINK